MTTDVIESGFYLIFIQESLSSTNRSKPSFAIAYINGDSMWINLQKSTDSNISNMTYSNNKIVITLSSSRYLTVSIFNMLIN